MTGHGQEFPCPLWVSVHCRSLNASLKYVGKPMCECQQMMHVHVSWFMQKYKPGFSLTISLGGSVAYINPECTQTIEETYRNSRSCAAKVQRDRNLPTAFKFHSLSAQFHCVILCFNLIWIQPKYYRISTRFLPFSTSVSNAFPESPFLHS